MALQQDVELQHRDWRAKQEQAELLALRNAEAVESAPPTTPQSKSGGLFGSLKRIFGGRETANR